MDKGAQTGYTAPNPRGAGSGNTDWWGTMRLDLHIHTNRSPDSLMTPEEVICTAQMRGLDGLALTDHNTIEGALVVRDRAPESFTVIVGEEVASSEGEIIGLFLERPIPKRMSPEETIAAIRDQGGIVYIPHPVDRLRHEAMGRAVLERIAHLVDALEVFNSRVLIHADNVLARRLAEQYGLAMGAGSDSHVPYEIGRAYVEIGPFDSPAAFLEALRRGRVTGRMTTPLIHLTTTLTKLGRRAACRLRPPA